MMRKFMVLVFILFACFSFLLHRAGCRELDSPASLPSQPWAGYDKMLKNGKWLYVLEEQRQSIVKINLKSNRVRRRFSVPPDTRDMLYENQHSLLLVSGVANGRLSRLDLRKDTVETLIDAGHYPVAPVLDETHQHIFVLNRFAGRATKIDLTTQSAASIHVGREPIAAALSPDGKTLCVAHLLPEQPSTAEHVAAKISFINTSDMSVAKQILLPNGSSGARNLALSADGRFVFVPHVIARYTLPTTQLERGWMNTNALSIIDLETRQRHATVLLDDVDQGAANPWDAACAADGKTLVVSHAGSNQLSLINLPELLQKLTAIPHPENRLDVLSECRIRVSTLGRAPRQLLADGNTVFAANYFSDSIDILTLDAEPKINTIQFGVPDLAQHQTGEYLFHTATTCFQGWQSCTSCHPDARADGFNWDLLNDYLGNPKNAKSLLYAHRTPPMNWTGIRENMEASVRAGMLHIQFHLIDEREAESIDTYLRMLDPVPSPYLVDGDLSDAARRGKALFESPEVGCADCHPAPDYTDLFAHNVGTHSPLDSTITLGGTVVPQLEFDTPSLVEAWRTAPYLHDGRYATVKEVITIGNHGDLRGRTSHLSDEQINDLVEFVNSL